MTKYVFCTPIIRGFNDMLCTINNCYNYCKKYNRTLLIDTSNSIYKFNFSEYFSLFSNDITITYNTEDVYKILNIEHYSYYPPNTDPIQKYCSKTNNSLQFDYTKDYNEDILVFSDSNSRHSPPKELLSFLKLNKSLTNIIKERYSLMDKSYLSIHIRNTDWISDYTQTYANNKEEISKYKYIYLATDSIDAFNYFNTLRLNIISYTHFTEKNEPLHTSKMLDKKILFIDMICDLFLLALANKLILSKEYHGFSKLAFYLNNNKDALFQILGGDPQF